MLQGSDAGIKSELLEIPYFAKPEPKKEEGPTPGERRPGVGCNTKSFVLCNQR
jgi:hypothetical protein